MTPDLLSRATGITMLHASQYVGPITAAMQEFEIDTPIRQAAYLAQTGHESGSFVWLRELWGAKPTPSQARYERDFSAPWPASPAESHLDAFATNRLAYALGNDRAGDGRRYMGRGPIQITGKRNYQVLGPKLGVDLERFPTLLEDVPQAFRSSGAFWQWKDCNALADANDFLGLTRRINGGTNGLDDRLTRWKRAKYAMGVS